MNNPARIEAELLALESLLEAGEIDETTYEAREATLLSELEALRTPAVVPGEETTTDQAPTQ
jgi:hypothetical protein